MKLTHKYSRETAICIGSSRFIVDAEGDVTPEVTETQWRLLGEAQIYFTIAEGPPAVAIVSAAQAQKPADQDFWTPDTPLPPQPTTNFSGILDSDDEDEDGSEDADGSFAGDVENLDDASDSEGTDGNYADMSYTQLKEICKERGIKTSRVAQAELVSLLVAQDIGNI